MSECIISCTWQETRVGVREKCSKKKKCTRAGLQKALNTRLRIFDFILRSMGSHRVEEQYLRRGVPSSGNRGGLEEASQAASILGKIPGYGLSSPRWALQGV